MNLKRFVVGLAILLLTEEFSNGIERPPIKVVPGAQLKHEKKAIAYETSIPILFQVKLPDVFFKDVPTNCRNAFECDIIDVERMTVKQMRQRIMEFTWSKEITREKRQLIIGAAALATGFLMRPIAGRIFPSLFGTETQMTERLNQVIDALGQEHADLMTFKSSVLNYTHSVENTIQELRETVVKQVIDLRGFTVHIISKLIILAHIRAQVNDFSHNIDLCHQRFLPTSLVTPNTFMEKLAHLETSLQGHNFKLALSEKQLHEYLQLPITDCLFTSDNAYISINIPILRKESEWKLYSILYTKFAYLHQVCDLYPQDALYLASSNDKSIVVHKNLKRNCDLENNHMLCYIPPFTHDSSEFLHCALSLLKGKSVSELHSICTFRCSTANGIITTQIDEDRIILTNVVNVTYLCGDNSMSFHFEKIGSVEIILMCDCTIFADNEIIKPFFPCSLKSELRKEFVFQLVPNTWTTLTGAISHQADLLFSSNIGLINHNWSTKIPVLNLTSLTFHLPSHFDSEYTYIDYWLWGLTAAFGLVFLGNICCCRMLIAPRV